MRRFLDFCGYLIFLGLVRAADPFRGCAERMIAYWDRRAARRMTLEEAQEQKTAILRASLDKLQPRRGPESGIS